MSGERRNFLAKIPDVAAWRRWLERQCLTARMRRGRRRVDALYFRLGPVSRGGAVRAVIADGLWDNPNHFFRLRLFLSAIPGIECAELVGILRRPDDAARTELESLGFRRFLFIDDLFALDAERYREQADSLLGGVRTHADFLALCLPDELPAYVVYDTVLKAARHPHPKLASPLWRETLAEALCYLDIYGRLIDEIRPSHVVMSHPWKDEYGIAVWAAIRRGVPAFHLTGYCEGIRIRRFLSAEDFFLPVEHLSRGDFEALPPAVRERLVEEGRTYLAERASGATTDINARMAFHPEQRDRDPAAVLRRLGLSGEKPVAAIYAHVWYDFPHTFAMRNFTDFQDWMEFTLAAIALIPEVDWLLKPHPTETWYGGFSLAELVRELPPHVHILAVDTDSLAITAAADIVVTCHGTVGLEAASNGRVVINADRSYYADWEISHVAASREDYVRLLKSVPYLAAPDAAARERAFALIAMVLAPARSGALSLRCDSSGPELFTDILRLYGNGDPLLGRETANMAAWLTTDSRSYAAHVKLGHLLAF